MLLHFIVTSGGNQNFNGTGIINRFENVPNWVKSNCDKTEHAHTHEFYSLVRTSVTGIIPVAFIKFQNGMSHFRSFRKGTLTCYITSSSQSTQKLRRLSMTHILCQPSWRCFQIGLGVVASKNGNMLTLTYPAHSSETSRERKTAMGYTRGML